MIIHTTIDSLRQALKGRVDVCFAPTMGNLHDGHISLMREARTHGNTVVSSIFVNPLQFGPNEDFAKYPRTFDADCKALTAAGVDHLLAPTESELYPVAQGYKVTPAPAHDAILEGACRPGHFEGVATVVAKLFNIVQPHTALFGKKDYQQLMVIRNMVQQLNMPINVVGCETVRANDGLALSSRNGYLTQTERLEAPRLFKTLQLAAAHCQSGESALDEIEANAINALKTAGWQPDYIAIRRQADLARPNAMDTKLVILAAARLGATRLIDNLELNRSH